MSSVRSAPGCSGWLACCWTLHGDSSAQACPSNFDLSVAAPLSSSSLPWQMDFMRCSWSTVSSSFKFFIISIFSCSMVLTSLPAADSSLPWFPNLDDDLFYSLRCCAMRNFTGGGRSELTRDSSGTAELASLAPLSTERGGMLSILAPPFN